MESGLWPLTTTQLSLEYCVWIINFAITVDFLRFTTFQQNSGFNTGIRICRETLQKEAKGIDEINFTSVSFSAADCL